MPRLLLALAAALAVEAVLLIVWWSSAENYDCARFCTATVLDVLTYAVVPAVIVALAAAAGVLTWRGRRRRRSAAPRGPASSS